MTAVPVTQLVLLSAAVALATAGIAVAAVQAERGSGTADAATLARAAERLEAWRELIARAAAGPAVAVDALEDAGVDADAASVRDLLEAVGDLGRSAGAGVEVRYTLDAVHAEREGRVRAEATLGYGYGGRRGGAGGTEARLLTFVRDGDRLRLIGDTDNGKGQGGLTPHNGPRHRAR